MKWDKMMGICIITVLLIFITSSMYNQPHVTQSILEFNIEYSSPQNPEFTVNKIKNTEGAQILSMTLDQNDQPHIIWHKMANPSTSPPPEDLGIYLSSKIDNSWKTIQIVSNIYSLSRPKIYSDQLNYLHLIWLRYEVREHNTYYTLFYANNVENDFKPELVFEVQSNTAAVGTILMDSTGRLHLVGTAKRNVFYAVRNQTWQVTWLTDKLTIDRSPRLLIDSEDRIHIIWIREDPYPRPVGWLGPYRLMYASETNGIWNYEQITEEYRESLRGPFVFRWLDADIDKNGQVNVIWITKEQCIEAFRTDKIWQLTKKPKNDVGRPCCLYKTQADTLCIAAWVDENRNLWYAQNQNGTCSLEQVSAEVGPKIGSASLNYVLDSNNEPHFAWTDRTSLFYAIRGLGVPIIDSPPDFLCIKDQLTNITWHPYDANPLHYHISRNGTLIEEGKWTGDTIVITLDALDVGVHQFVLTVVDKNNLSAQDTVLVTVVEKPPITLTGTPDGWEVIRLTANNQKDNRPSMALDSEGQPHILWHGPLSPSAPSYMDSNMYYGRFENGTWVTYCLRSAWGWGSAAIAIDANDEIHTVCSPPTIEGPLSVCYGKATSPHVSHCIIPEKSINTPVQSIKIIVDTENNPHITVLYYQYFPSHVRFIEYGTKLNGSWQVEPVWNSTKNGIKGSPSLVVDLSSRPHLIWQGDNGIYYATRTAGRWDTKLIPNITISSSPSLAIDSANLPHIAWEGEGRLYYMRKTTDAWEKSQIPTQSEQNHAPSLYLDSKDQPHLVWSGIDGSDYEIFYALKNQDNWKITQITDNVNLDNDPLLLLDDKDRPHIAWVMGENENQEIMFATFQDISTSDKPQLVSLSIFSILLALAFGSLLRRRFKSL